jgi:ferritin heavy chain
MISSRFSAQMAHGISAGGYAPSTAYAHQPRVARAGTMGSICGTPISPLSPAVHSARFRTVVYAKKNKGLSTTTEASVETKTLENIKQSSFLDPSSQLATLDETPSTNSLGRQRYSEECEDALNEQINVEYNVSYMYHCMFAYFGRDNVSLPGFSEYFKAASLEERGHAEQMMEYQLLRGGKVKLFPIFAPAMHDFDHDVKGDALYAMELSLALEKLNNEKLLSLQQVATDNDDPQMTDYIEGTFLGDQVQSIYKTSKLVSELKRVGQGHGVWNLDRQLADGI